MTRFVPTLPLVLALISGIACDQRNAPHADRVVETANDARAIQRSLEDHARANGGSYPSTLQALTESMSPGAAQTEMRRLLTRHPGIVYVVGATATWPSSLPADGYVLRVPTRVDCQDWIHVTPGGDVTASSNVDPRQR